MPQAEHFKAGELVFFSIRIPSHYHEQFPVSRLIGGGKIARVVAVAEPAGTPQLSIAFGDELAMIAASS